MLVDWQIRELCAAENPMISPFVDHQVRTDGDRKIVSYGLSSSGYDCRLANKFRVFNNRKGGLIDPLDFNHEKLLVDEEGDFCDIAPNSYILGYSYERFDIPANIVADCVGKSTYARCGLIVNVTPLENMWQGWLTIELANSTPCPLRVYADMGIAQIRFFYIDKPTVTYDSRNGKYQNQKAEPVTAKI